MSTARAVPEYGWIKVLDESAYTIKAFAAIYGLPRRQVSQWLAGKATPCKKNADKLDLAMKDLLNKPRLTRHPSYGYATEEQIKRLELLGIGPEREQLLKQIAKQTETRGKVY